MRCPHCGADNGIHTAAESGGRQEPMKGDLSVCIQCHNLTRFDDGEDGLYMRKIADEELFEMVQQQPDLENQLRQAKLVTDTLKQINLL